MRATELRIGNWVKLDLVGTQNQVTQILEKGVNCGTIGVLYEMIKPIPLTEEWLERFGFEYDENNDCFVFESNKGVSFSMDKNGVMYYFGNLEPLWVDTLSKIKYVHQLQNLYFALTGEELQTDETDKKVNL